jgi:hypothetical protein
LLLLLLQALLGVIDIIRGDMYTHAHVRYYMREVRLVAYNQVRYVQKGIYVRLQSCSAELAAELALVLLVGLLLPQCDAGNAAAGIGQDMCRCQQMLDWACMHASIDRCNFVPSAGPYGLCFAVFGELQVGDARLHGHRLRRGPALPGHRGNR